MAQLLAYEQFLIQIQRSAIQGMAVVMVELRGLAEIDELSGFSMVNKLMHEACGRVVDGLRPVDVVCQMGRHHFAVMLPNIANDQFAILAGHKIQRLLSSPYHSHLHRLNLSPVLGMATFIDANETIEHIFCRAMTALRQAHEAYETLRLYKGNKEGSTPTEFLAMKDLETALDENELKMVFQPQYSYAQKAIVSCEALLRWVHPEYGLINTEGLIRLVERSNLIGKLTAWVISTAFRRCSEFRQSGLPIGVHVNLSAANLSEPDLVDLIRDQLTIWNVPASEVIIELTETAAIKQQSHAFAQLLELKKNGILLSMDDFGSGYANLDRLIQLPLDEIKIDQFFIKSLPHNPAVERILAGIIDTAHRMEINVVAEGVEDLKSFEILRQLKCDIVQGYLISHPLSHEELITIYTN